MAEKKITIKKDTKAVTPKIEYSFVFGKENYALMAAGIVVIALGFTLMSGKEDIFSSTKLTIAPIVVVLGFVIELFAIMYKGKEE